MSVSSEGASAPARTVSGDADRRFYLAAWRWHFYAGLYVAPFLVMLAITGLAMMYIAVFDGRDGEHIAVAVPPSATQLSVVEQSEKALQAVTGGTLVEWIRPAAADRASVFRIATGDDQSMVAVDPYSGAVLDTWDRRAGWYDFVNDIHGTLLIGTVGDRMIEIAAGFAVVLVVTGLYLWWPRGTGMFRAFVPNFAERGRALFKSLHVTVGVYVSLILIVFLLSGLSWAGIWGERFVQAWSTFPAEKWDNVPLSDDIHASMNQGAQRLRGVGGRPKRGHNFDLTHHACSFRRGRSLAKLHGVVRMSSCGCRICSQARRTAPLEPGRQNTSVPLATPPRARDCMVEAPMSANDR